MIKEAFEMRRNAAKEAKKTQEMAAKILPDALVINHLRVFALDSCNYL
jgi:hypothetical protein